MQNVLVDECCYVLLHQCALYEGWSGKWNPEVAVTQHCSSLAHWVSSALNPIWGRKTQLYFFFQITRESENHRLSKTGLRNLGGQLCMIQGFTLNGFPGKVSYCIVCWFVGHSSGGCHSDCLHFLSVAAHIKDCVLVSIIVTNWILHFSRTHVTNLQQSESLCVCAPMFVCLEGRQKTSSLRCKCVGCMRGKVLLNVLLWIRRNNKHNITSNRVEDVAKCTKDWKKGEIRIQE